jgi:hypothetical protein
MKDMKTAGQSAAFTYISQPVDFNNYTPVVYDSTAIKDYYNEKPNHYSYKVYGLLKTGRGNCRSMPFLMKILADEFDCKTYITTVPRHYYILHEDEEGNMWNVDVTSGTFPRKCFLKSFFHVSEKGIESGLYMRPLDGKELLVLLLYNLYSTYSRNTGFSSSRFIRDLYTIGLRYDPVSFLQFAKHNDLATIMDVSVKKLHLTHIKQLDNYPSLHYLHNEIIRIERYLEKIGYVEITNQELIEFSKKITKENLDPCTMEVIK